MPKPDPPFENCPDCAGQLTEVKVLSGIHTFRVAPKNAKQNMWTGFIEGEGTMDAYSCADCGRIYFYRNPR